MMLHMSLQITEVLKSHLFPYTASATCKLSASRLSHEWKLPWPRLERRFRQIFVTSHGAVKR